MFEKIGFFESALSIKSKVHFRFRRKILAVALKHKREVSLENSLSFLTAFLVFRIYSLMQRNIKSADVA